jgi:hypothetical protein
MYQMQKSLFSSAYNVLFSGRVFILALVFIPSGEYTSFIYVGPGLLI